MTSAIFSCAKRWGDIWRSWEHTKRRLFI